MAVVKKKTKKKPKEKQTHRVYVTYFPNGDYYIGYSGKTQKLYEKYYGSSKYVLEYEGQLDKETTINETIAIVKRTFFIIDDLMMKKNLMQKCVSFYYNGSREKILNV